MYFGNSVDPDEIGPAHLILVSVCKEFLVGLQQKGDYNLALLRTMKFSIVKTEE